jgi:hypothetical protein
MIAIDVDRPPSTSAIRQRGSKPAGERHDGGANPPSRVEADLLRPRGQGPDERLPAHDLVRGGGARGRDGEREGDRDAPRANACTHRSRHEIGARRRSSRVISS